MATSSIQANSFNFRASFMRTLQEGDTLFVKKFSASYGNQLFIIIITKTFYEMQAESIRTNRSNACLLMLNTDLFS